MKNKDKLSKPSSAGRVAGKGLSTKWSSYYTAGGRKERKTSSESQSREVQNSRHKWRGFRRLSKSKCNNNWESSSAGSSQSSPFDTPLNRALNVMKNKDKLSKPSSAGRVAGKGLSTKWSSYYTAGGRKERKTSSESQSREVQNSRHKWRGFRRLSKSKCNNNWERRSPPWCLP